MEDRLAGSLALHSCRLELSALLPGDRLGEAGCFPAQREAKARHRRIPGEIHVGTVFVARLMIVLFSVFLVLCDSPGLVVVLELHAFVDRERWNPDARQ